jgi:hypothetical protein
MGLPPSKIYTKYNAGSMPSFWDSLSVPIFNQALNYKTPLQFPRDSGIVDSGCPSNLSHM